MFYSTMAFPAARKNMIVDTDSFGGEKMKIQSYFHALVFIWPK